MRLVLLCLLACCGTQPSASSSNGPDVGLDLDLRCKEDCAYYDAEFDGVEYERAITGEDSWFCFCRKADDTIVQVW